MWGLICLLILQELVHSRHDKNIMAEISRLETEKQLTADAVQGDFRQLSAQLERQFGISFTVQTEKAAISFDYDEIERHANKGVERP